MAARRPVDIHVLSAQRRDTELRRAEEARQRARFYKQGDAARHHEAWSTSEYYERAKKDAENLAQGKLKAAKLEERRKKLERMLFQESLQFQQELKDLSSKPKLFKNGSYLNAVPTSTLADINQGIKAKEEELRRREAELQLYHSWRAGQPAIRDAEARIRNGALKTAWMEQIVEKEMQKKKEEEETRRSLKERDEYLQRQIEIEQEKLKEKEHKMMELKSGLESQISELSQAETAVEALRKEENKEIFVLEQLRFINEERIKEHQRLISERGTALVNFALHRHRLRVRAAQIQKEIDLDIEMIQRLWDALAKEYQEHQERKRLEEALRPVEAAQRSLREERERERQRQMLIDSMLDGEARLINEKQDRLWAKEREARQTLMEEVIATLNKQVLERLEANRERQRQNVLEREKILDDIDKYNKEVQDKERERQYTNSQYGGITALQSELKTLQLEASRLEESKAQELAARAVIEEEELVRKELARMHRDGVSELSGRRKFPVVR